MTKTTRQPESTALQTLYASLELGDVKWHVAVTTAAQERPRHYTIDAGDVPMLLEKLERARSQSGLPAGTPLVTCYEAGRDGFWLHRCLTAHGVTNVVVDPTTIERDARAKHVKTDRVDAEQLLERLIDWREGRRQLRVVHVPSVAEEDARQADRELASAKGVRTAITNRITSLLVAQGLRVSASAVRRQDLTTLRLWDGTGLPPGLAGRLERELDELEAVDARIALLERERRQAIEAEATPAARQMAQLMRLAGIGPNGASRLVLEFFGWRAFANGRQIGALAGLTPTPYDSGTRCREQGISKAGNARVRTMAIELGWCWHRFQPQSALTRWFDERFGGAGKRHRRVGIVALARKLLIALWRFLETGVVPEGAVVKAAG